MWVAFFWGFSFVSCWGYKFRVARLVVRGLVYFLGRGNLEIFRDFDSLKIDLKN